MQPRFWMASPLQPGPCTLEGPEAHHLSHVLRLDVGTAVELFDGRGGVAEASIRTVAKRAVHLWIDSVRETPRSSPEIVLAVAVPKGERFDWLVEKAAELGVDRLVPLLTERGTVDPRDSKLERLRQVVIAACKQSRNNWAMELLAPVTWCDFLASLSAGQRLYIADPSGTRLSRDEEMSVTTVVAVGPEGGWTESELAEGIRHGGQLVTLGSTILRIETAALAAVAILRS